MIKTLRQQMSSLWNPSIDNLNNARIHILWHESSNYGGSSWGHLTRLDDNIVSGSNRFLMRENSVTRNQWSKYQLKGVVPGSNDETRSKRL